MSLHKAIKFRTCITSPGEIKENLKLYVHVSLWRPFSLQSCIKMCLSKKSSQTNWYFLSASLTYFCQNILLRGPPTDSLCRQLSTNCCRLLTGVCWVWIWWPFLKMEKTCSDNSIENLGVLFDFTFWAADIHCYICAFTMWMHVFWRLAAGRASLNTSA